MTAAILLQWAVIFQKPTLLGCAGSASAGVAILPEW
jgi:hypothetical protein